MRIKEIFNGNNGKLSSKRTIGIVVMAISVSLWVDSHFNLERVLNEKAFDAAMYIAGLMIIGGVLEGKFTQQNSAPTPPSEEPEEDYK